MEIADSAYKFQRQLESKEKIMVGMNKYVTDTKHSIPLLEIDEKIGEEQIKRLKDVRRKRDNRATKKSLDDIKMPARKV